MPGRKPLSPPPAAVRILEATLPAPDRDMVIGDLSEQFARRVEAGRLASGIWFFAQACLFAAYSIYSTSNARRVGRLRTPADWLTRRHVMESFRTGLRQSVRRLVHDWRYSAAVILILSVGIGPAAAMLSVVENVLLRPLAYHEPERLGLLRIDLGELRNHPGLSPAEAIDMRKSGLFASVESQTRLAEVSLGPTDNLVSLSQLSFTTGTLPMLGVVPVLAVRPQIYVPIGNLFQNAGIVMVRANGDPRPMASAVIEAIREIGPGRAVSNVSMLSDNVDAATSTLRAVTALVTCLAISAGLLSAIGLYLVVAFVVHQQRRATAIRSALGASRAQVMRHHLSASGSVMVAALPIGLLLSLVAAPLFADLAYGVGPCDAGSLTIALIVAVCAGALGTYVPVRRAANANVGKVLREG